MRAAEPMMPSAVRAMPSTIFVNTALSAATASSLPWVKLNEPRADIYMATTGHYLGFIPTLEHPEMVGVNPRSPRADGRTET